ncbi:MAG: hypothetical protein K2L51_07680 [Clostridiales bacterium]|nr:hypothetical protein [Clostridiales bacterium]
MIPIDIGKFHLSCKIDTKHCMDGSVRLIRYTEPTPPDEYVTMNRYRNCYDEITRHYTLSVHLPPLREVSSLVTVAHTSPNCWKVTVSTLERSDIITCKTLNEVTEKLKNVFG